MAGRGRTSSQKRRKEQNRLEKRQTKAERKATSKTDKGPEEDDLVVLQGPIPIEYDPNLDRGLTPDLVPDVEEPEHAPHT